VGLFGFVSGLFGGGSQKKASQKATDALTAAYNRGIDLQNQQYQTTRQDYMPYTQAGVGAIGELSNMITGYGDDPLALAERLKSNPLYGALYRNGEEALLQNASATGGLRGGDTQRGLADFGADTLGAVYNSQLSNLYNLSNLGLGATGSVANAGMNATNNVTSLVGNIGQAQATNYLTKGGINAANWQNAGSFLDGLTGAFAGGGGIKGALKSIF
jgi:hypothetical protein